MKEAAGGGTKVTNIHQLKSLLGVTSAASTASTATGAAVMTKASTTAPGSSSIEPPAASSPWVMPIASNRRGSGSSTGGFNNSTSNNNPSSLSGIKSITKSVGVVERAASLRDIQQQQQAEPRAPPAVATELTSSSAMTQAPVALPAKWASTNSLHGGGSSHNNSAASLREIMTQEERVQQAYEQSSGAASRAAAASSWAAKLGGSAGGPPLSSSLAPSTWTTPSTSSQAISRPAATGSASSAGAVVAVNKNVSASPAALSYNGPLPPDLAEYCAAQLMIHKGDRDLALMEYVYSLESSVEIRAFIAQYLGSTPQVVSNYTTDCFRFGLYSNALHLR